MRKLPEGGFRAAACQFAITLYNPPMLSVAEAEKQVLAAVRLVIVIDANVLKRGQIATHLIETLTKRPNV